MKLLYVANVRLPTEKAHGLQIMQTCAALARQGVDVELAVPRRRNSIHKTPFEYYGIPANFKITWLPTLDFVRLGPIGFWLQSRTFAISARQYLQQIAPDAVYSRDEKILAWISPACPFAWESHDGRWNAEAANISNRVRMIAVTSVRLKKLYLAKGIPEAKLSVIPHGITISEFTFETSRSELRQKLDIPTKRKIITYVGKYGMMGKPKGVEGILEAFSIARTTHPDLFLLVVGLETNEVPLIKRYLASINVAESDYILITHVPHDLVSSYLYAADLLAMNYPNEPIYANIVSPLKQLEYMASGTPIISSDLPSIRELLPANMAFYAQPDDPRSYSSAITEALEHPEEAARRAALAREEAKKFTWDERARKIKDRLGTNPRL